MTTEQQEQGLLPCPHCGCDDPILVSYTEGHGTTYRVECECDVQGIQNSTIEAIALWQARANSPAVVEEALDEAWPLHDILRKLAFAADHLGKRHDCDHHGYEEIIAAKDAAYKYLERPSAAAVVEDERVREIRRRRNTVYAENYKDLRERYEEDIDYLLSLLPVLPARSRLTKSQADWWEAEMRQIEANPAFDKRAMRLFMQTQMECGHSVGSLLTCPDPPFGCVDSGEPVQPAASPPADCNHVWHLNQVCNPDLKACPACGGKSYG